MESTGARWRWYLRHGAGCAESELERELHRRVVLVAGDLRTLR